MSNPDKDESFRTPDRKKSMLDRVKSLSATPTTPGSASLMKIPASPCLEKLGFGTGVNVFLYQRSPSSGNTLCSLTLHSGR